MILAAALTLALAAPPVGAQDTETDPIVVVGERLRRAGGVISVNAITGKMKCRVTNPSGEQRIDTAACEIALGCAKQSRRDRDRFNTCVEAGYEAFLDEYFSDGPASNAPDQ